jgi:hypothetical protein
MPAGAAAQEASFVRGDSNVDGLFDVSDAVFTLRVIFMGEPPAGCDDAADVNDDGFLNITDGIYGLRYLFSDGPPPPEPFVQCGVDVTVDEFGCERYAPCEGESECLDASLLDELVGEVPGFSICVPSGLPAVELEGFSVVICPEASASTCELTEEPGCPLEITSIGGTLDGSGRRVVLRIEGRLDRFPLDVTEPLFGSTTTCEIALHGEDPALPFGFDFVLPLEVVPIEPGVEEIIGTGEVTVENIDVALTASGGLVCVLFGAGQGLFIEGLLAQLASLAQAVVDPVGAQLVGLRLCETGTP